MAIERSILLAGEAAPCAVSAVHRALVRDKKQNPVRVAVRQSGTGRIGILMQRIALILRRNVELVRRGNCLPADGIVGIFRINQRQVVRRNCHPVGIQAFADALTLHRRQVQIGRQLLRGLNPILELPVPVVPVLRRNIRINTFFHDFIFSADSAEILVLFFS